MDLTYFPYDTQVCHLRIVFLNSHAELRVETNPEKPSQGDLDSLGNGEWDVRDITTTIPAPLTPEEPVAMFVYVTIERRPFFFMMNILLPVMTCSSLSSLVFILPVTSGERASFSTTLMLAQTVFIGTVTSDLPKVSDPFPVIMGYLITLTSLNSFCVIATVLQMRSNNKVKPSDTCKKDKSSDSCKKDKSSETFRNDKSSDTLKKDKSSDTCKKDQSSATYNNEKSSQHFVLTTSASYHLTDDSDYLYYRPKLGDPHIDVSCPHSDHLYHTDGNSVKTEPASGRCGVCGVRSERKDFVLFTVYIACWSVVNVVFMSCLIFH